MLTFGRLLHVYGKVATVAMFACGVGCLSYACCMYLQCVFGYNWLYVCPILLAHVIDATCVSLESM